MRLIVQTKKGAAAERKNLVLQQLFGVQEILK